MLLSISSWFYISTQFPQPLISDYCSLGCLFMVYKFIKINKLVRTQQNKSYHQPVLTKWPSVDMLLLCQFFRCLQLILEFVDNNLKSQLQMQEESPMQACSNCLKQFPVDRIDLHEAYCCRNIRKCSQCDKMIDIKDLQHHNKQFHDQVECTMCKQMIEPQDAQVHKDNCPKKPMVCKYCENSWPQAEYMKHLDSCGARTKPCLICHKNIMLKDFEEHSGRCQRRREERAEVSQDQMRERANRRNDRVGAERERQNSTNNIREHPIKSNSINKIVKPASFKPSNIIGPEIIKAAIDPVPISVRIAMKNKDLPRMPLKSKN